jgi:hypothetical protein
MEHQIYRNRSENSSEINLDISRTLPSKGRLERGGDGGERHDRVGVGEDAHPSIMLSTVVSRCHDFERGGHDASGGPHVERGEEPS